MAEPIVAKVQVRTTVRRPVEATTFLATEVAETDNYVRVRGHWRGSTEQRTYTLPWASVTALRWIGEGS